MKRSIILLCAALLRLGTAAAQEPGTPWTLDDCIRYAQEQNIAVQKQALQVEQSRVRLNTAQLSRLPDLGASLNGQMAFGRSKSSQDTYIDANTLTGSAGISASLPVFQGLRIKRQIAGGKFDLRAAVADFERAREDVAVNVMSLYLQVLFNKELVAVAESQLALSSQQVERSRALVANGKNPESALYESIALRSKDELTLTQARGDLSLALLDLSQALNRPSAEGFDIVDPDLDSTAVDALSHLRSPAEITAYALDNRPHIRAEQLRLASSSEAIRLARPTGGRKLPLREVTAPTPTNTTKGLPTGPRNPSGRKSATTAASTSACRSIFRYSIAWPRATASGRPTSVTATSNSRLPRPSRP